MYITRYFDTIKCLLLMIIFRIYNKKGILRNFEFRRRTYKAVLCRYIGQGIIFLK